MESDGRFMIIIIMRERPRRMYLGGQAEKETPWCFVHWGHRGPSTHTESASLRAHSPRAHHYWRMYNFFMSGVLCACVICVHNEPIYCSILMGWNMNWLEYGWRGTVHRGIWVSNVSRFYKQKRKICCSQKCSQPAFSRRRLFFQIGRN